MGLHKRDRRELVVLIQLTDGGDTQTQVNMQLLISLLESLDIAHSPNARLLYPYLGHPTRAMSLGASWGVLCLLTTVNGSVAQENTFGFILSCSFSVRFIFTYI